MKLIHTADNHINATTHGGINPATGLDVAFESNRDAAASVVTAALANQVDAYISAGDFFDNGKPSPEAVLAAADVLAPLGRARIPIVLVGGNHELRGVPVGQRTATALLADALAGLVPGAEVHTVERQARLVVTSTGLQVMCLPWQSKSRLPGRAGDPAAADRQMVDHVLAETERMFCVADLSTPLVLAAHLSVSAGARRGSEQDLADLFDEPLVPVADLEVFPFAYGALGHIHTRQRVGARCYYPGSPNRLTMADADTPRSANLVDIMPGRTSVHAVPTTARPMRVIDLAVAGADGNLAGLEPGSLVKFILPEGVSELAELYPEAVRAVGGKVVGTVRRPAVPAERATRADPLPELIDPVEALRARLSATRTPDEVARICAVAARLNA